MRITGLALVPPPSAADLPKVTPELLASVLARYSRSNEGIGAILSKVDIANPDASIDHPEIRRLWSRLDWRTDRRSRRRARRRVDVARV